MAFLHATICSGLIIAAIKISEIAGQELKMNEGTLLAGPNSRG